MLTIINEYKLVLRLKAESKILTAMVMNFQHLRHISAPEQHVRTCRKEPNREYSIPRSRYNSPVIAPAIPYHSHSNNTNTFKRNTKNKVGNT